MTSSIADGTLPRSADGRGGGANRWAAATATTVGPWAGQFTRGASASNTTCTVPQSRPRHRRRPSPRPYRGALRLTAATTPRNTTSRPHPRHHQRVAVGVFLLALLELDVFDHGALVDTQQRTP